MGLDNLFKLIRKEDVALWVGAGFSLYAGYPSGKKLQEIIYQELTDSEKTQLATSESLRNTASAFVNFRGGSRNELNSILKKSFAQKPTGTHLHDLLSHIPHFDTIITTNYDSMIEESYTRRADVLRYDRDIPYIKSNKVSIYKPHGDLISTDRIIITNEDYIGFRAKPESPFWISILDILSKKSLFFLGYSFEDENVWAWLDLIDKYIKTDRKQRFLISPNWPERKIQELQEHHIEYINMTADTFLFELTKELRLNIIPDLENGVVSQNTFNQFFNLQQIDAHIKTFHGKPIVAGLSKPGKLLSSQINLQFKDEKLAKQLNKFNKGIGKSLNINSNQLSLIELFVEDFKMNMSTNTIKSFELIRAPQNHKACIEFPDDDFLVEDINFEVYRKNQKTTVIECDCFGYCVKLSITQNSEKRGIDIVSEFVAPKQFPSVAKSLIFHKIFFLLSKGRRVIYKWGDKVLTNVHITPHSDTEKIANTFQYFENLRKIEKAFLVDFTGVEINASKSNLTLIQNLTKLIEKGYLLIDFEDGVAITSKENTLDKLIINMPKHTQSIFFKTGEKQTVKLYNRIIQLGDCGLEIVNVEYKNYEPEKNTLVAISKTGEYRQRFSSTFDFDSVRNLDEEIFL